MNILESYNLQISVLGLVVSVCFRIAAAVFFYLVAKKAYYETRIKNGLIILRQQLLTVCVIMFFVNTAGMGLLIARPFVSPELFRACTDSLSVLNSAGFFIVAYLLWKIYTQQYTPEQKERHRQIAELEKNDKS